MYFFRLYFTVDYDQFFSGHSLGSVQLFVTPWTTAHQASLSITSSQRSLKLMSTEPGISSNHLILCRPLLLQPSIFLSIRVFSKELASPLQYNYLRVYLFEALKLFLQPIKIKYVFSFVQSQPDVLYKSKQEH